MSERLVTHAELQDTVVKALGWLGWEHLHVRRSIGKGRKWTTATSKVGWPDLFCWHPHHRRLFAIELKVPPDRLTHEQYAILVSLDAAGVETAVIEPDDLGELGQLLDPRGPRHELRMVEAFAPR